MNVDKFKNDWEKIVYAIFEEMLKYISPKLRIFDDKQGLFLDMGSENGLLNCDLVLDNGEIISPELYTIENTRTIFNKNKIGDITKLRNKLITVRYKIKTS